MKKIPLWQATMIFYDYLEASGKSHNTIYQHALKLELFKEYIGEDLCLNLITKEQILDFFKSNVFLEKSEAQKNKIKRTIQNFFQWVNIAKFSNLKL